MKLNKRDYKDGLCGELLYEDGKLVASCIQPWGTEHSHHDHTALEAIQSGIAVGITKELINSDTLNDSIR